MMKLRIDQLIAGKSATLQNAEELISEAEVLFGKARWPRVVFLSQIAIEECGKYLMIINAIGKVLAGNVDWGTFWKRFRSHTEKTGNVLAFDVFLGQYTSPEDTLRRLEKSKHDETVLEHKKLASLYVDFHSDQFHLPTDTVDEKIARKALADAKAVLSVLRHNDKRFFSNLSRIARPEYANLRKELATSLQGESDTKRRVMRKQNKSNKLFS